MRNVVPAFLFAFLLIPGLAAADDFGPRFYNVAPAALGDPAVQDLASVAPVVEQPTQTESFALAASAPEDMPEIFGPATR